MIYCQCKHIGKSGKRNKDYTCTWKTKDYLAGITRKSQHSVALDSIPLLDCFAFSVSRIDFAVSFDSVIMADSDADSVIMNNSDSDTEFDEYDVELNPHDIDEVARFQAIAQRADESDDDARVIDEEYAHLYEPSEEVVVEPDIELDFLADEILETVTGKDGKTNQFEDN